MDLMQIAPLRQKFDVLHICVEEAGRILERDKLSLLRANRAVSVARTTPKKDFGRLKDPMNSEQHFASFRFLLDIFCDRLRLYYYRPLLTFYKLRRSNF